MNEHGGSLTPLRVFVGSPGDVADERRRVERVVKDLNQTLSEYFQIVFQIKEWRQVVPDMGRPQGVIFEQLPVESWDIFVGILWLRFGTPPAAVHPATGHAFESGTEEEFTFAHQLWQQCRRPRILFYRCTRPPVSMSAFDSEQYALVQRFFKGFDASFGAHPGLYCEYTDAIEFERNLREHLTKLLIDRHKACEERPMPASTPAAPSEFRNPFIVGNPITRAEDFFGREAELRYVVARLATGQSTSIVGPRRIGKTSLLHRAKQAAVAREPRFVPVFLDLLSHGARTLPGLLGLIQKRLGIAEPAETLGGFEERIEGFADKGHQPLLCLDEVDLFIRLPGEFSHDFCESLRSLATAGKMVLLTASRLSLDELYQRGAMVSQLYNIMGTQALDLFSDEEAEAFVRWPRPGVTFNENQVSEILKRSERHPLRLQGYCWHVAQGNAEGRKQWSEVWKAANTELRSMLTEAEGA